MTDMLVELGASKLARDLVARAKLPIPLPQRLERAEGGSVERPLEGKSVLLAGEGALSGPLARTLARAGATALLHSEGMRSAFSAAAEAYARPLKVAPSEPQAEDGVHAIVLDATRFTSPANLKQLWQVFKPWLPVLGPSGRALILARPAESARNAGEAAARSALDGFIRSLAKEIGGKGATANLVYVEEEAEERLPAVLRFLLTNMSAFISAQPLRVRGLARWDGADPITQPLAQKLALVTGAARGIGEATARVLSAEGAHVLCLDRPEDDAALSLVARDVGGSLLLADVTSADAPARIAAYVTEKYGGVDIVVHNAGVTRDRTMARMAERLWDQTIDINLGAVLAITNKLLDSGALRDQGRVVSLSSIAGIAGNTGQTNYAASKAGLIGFTRKLAVDLAPRGITVNAVAPGFIETRMTAAVPVVVREVGRRLAALGQGGRPDDVARAIAFLSMPGSAGVTGGVLRVCGGAFLGA